MLSVQRPRPMSGIVTEPAYVRVSRSAQRAAWYGRKRVSMKGGLPDPRFTKSGPRKGPTPKRRARRVERFTVHRPGESQSLARPFGSPAKAFQSSVLGGTQCPATVSVSPRALRSWKS